MSDLRARLLFCAHVRQKRFGADSDKLGGFSRRVPVQIPWIQLRNAPA